MKKTIIKILGITVLIITIIVLIYFKFFYNTEEIPQIIQVANQEEIIPILNLGIAEFDTINPIKSQNKYVQQISKLIYEPLFEIDSEFKLTKKLATEITKLNDLTYILKFKENTYFHNGDILSPQDILYTIDQIKENKDSIYYPNIANIQNIKIIDETTIRINLYESDSFFEYNLIFPILNKEEAGTGMYEITKLNAPIELNYNTKYWNSELPNITQIKINIYKEVTDLYQGFKDGEIDVLYTSNTNYENFLGTIGYEKKEYMGRVFSYLVLNLESKLLKEQELRKAICHTINKTEIVSKIYKNHVIADFPLEYVSWLYKKQSWYTYDLDKAINLLEKNGWEYQDNVWQKKKNELELNFLVDSLDKEANDVAYLVKQQLQKIGIQVNIEKVSTKLYKYYLKTKNYDIILKKQIVGIAPNLDTFLGEENTSNYKRTEITETLEKIKTTNEDSQILYEQIEKYYLEDIPFISIAFNKEIMLYNTKIHGNVIPNWYQIFNHIEKWKILNI